MVIEGIISTGWEKPAVGWWQVVQTSAVWDVWVGVEMGDLAQIAGLVNATRVLQASINTGAEQGDRVCLREMTYRGTAFLPGRGANRHCCASSWVEFLLK